MAGVQPFKRASYSGGVHACGVDDAVGDELGAVLHFEHQAIGSHLSAGQWCVQHHHAACMLQIPLQSQHERVAVHDAGAGGVQRGHAVQRGLHRYRLLAGEQDEVGHSVGSGFGLNGLQLGLLRFMRSHDQLAATAMANAACLAIGVKHLPPLHAQPRLERALRVVDARVDDFAVA